MRTFMHAAILFLTFSAASAGARDINVKYQGVVNVDSFECTEIDRSSFIHEICYNAPTEYLLIQLKSTFYHYCSLNSEVYDELMSAPSMGKFYNANIKGNFDCRLFGAPDFN
jgi:hypothetical protein